LELKFWFKIRGKKKKRKAKVREMGAWRGEMCWRSKESDNKENQARQRQKLKLGIVFFLLVN
jgi:hypothetical protein